MNKIYFKNTQEKVRGRYIIQIVEVKPRVKVYGGDVLDNIETSRPCKPLGHSLGSLLIFGLLFGIILVYR